MDYLLLYELVYYCACSFANAAVGNRHDLKHFACSFHVINPYLIYVIECTGIGGQGRFSYKDSDKSHLNYMLI